MPGFFIARPVDPGYDQIGAGIAQGLRSGLNAYLGGQRQQKLDQEHAEDRAYLNTQRAEAEQARARQQRREDAADQAAGIRSGPAPNPLAERIGALRAQMANPMPTIFSGRTLLPGQLDPDAGSFDRAAARTGEIVPLASGGYVDRAATPEGEKLRFQQAQRAQLDAAIQGLVGTGQLPAAAAEIVKIHPDLLDNYLFPQPEKPDPFSEFQKEYDYRRAHPMPKAGDEGPDKPLLTFDDALRQAREFSTVKDANGRAVGFSRTEREMVDLAKALQRGDYVEPAGDPDAMLGGAGTREDPYQAQPAHAVAPARRPRSGTVPSPNRSTGGNGTWQQRASQLRSSGMSDQQIVQQLRKEGLIQ